MPFHHLIGATLLLVMLLSACRDEDTSEQKTADPAAAASVQPSRSQADQRAQHVGPRNASEVPSPCGISAAMFGRMVNDWSEPDGDFISDNVISNETTYLDVAETLVTTPSGGVYLGVGPEQNFSYVALTQPKLAIIVDLRRDNQLLHLLYKAIFAEAEDRDAFLRALLGRPVGSDTKPEAQDASLQEIITRIRRSSPQRVLAQRNRTRWLDRIEQKYGFALSADDRKRLQQLHDVVFREQLAMRFRLKGHNHWSYPTFEQLLLTRAPNGPHGSFLANSMSYQRVRRLQLGHCILPIVGDFAGPKALQKVGAYLSENNLRVNTFYVSNVEQYLLGTQKWQRWLDNVFQLPWHPRGYLVRAYFDQGSPHPQQREGHRTTTLLQPLVEYRSVAPEATSFLALASGKSSSESHDASLVP